MDGYRLGMKSQANRKTTRRLAKKPARRKSTVLGTFVPYTVELVTVHPTKPPVKHCINVYMNGELYVIELHSEHPPTRHSQVGLYGQQWTITKVRSDKAKAITQYTVALAGGRITRYTVLTRSARKLEKYLAIYEAQQEQIEKATAHEKKNRNDHYVSQVLLRRFTDNKRRLQKYTLKYGKWSPSAPKSIFSEYGYNQLLAFGKYNNDLDERLKTLEDTLPLTLEALDNAAKAKETTLDSEIYERMCSYCAFIWNMSPFSKAVAPVNFIVQMMMDLGNGNVDLLDTMGVKDDGIAEIKRHFTNGAKFIITGKNYLQLVYRLQFARTLECTNNIFRGYTKWTVVRSPVEMPIADMALIQYHEPALKLMRSVLPISSTSVLIGESPMGSNLKSSTDTIVYGGEAAQPFAEYIREVICQSAILTVASKTRFADISALRQKPIVNLVQLQNIDAVLNAGETPILSEQDFLITPATTEAYVKWTHSIVKPYSKL